MHQMEANKLIISCMRNRYLVVVVRKMQDARHKTRRKELRTQVSLLAVG